MPAGGLTFLDFVLNGGVVAVGALVTQQEEGDVEIGRAHV